MVDRQLQKAGPGSHQIQVSGDLVVVEGVTEERAREIAEATAQRAIAEYTEEAESTALSRIRTFDEELLGRLAESDILGALADPGVQVLLRRAQVGAACTERPKDHQMLAGLIEDRVRRGSERHVRAGINRAVEVVDQIEESALMGLTVFWAATRFTPAVGPMEQGLDAWESLFSQLIVDELPLGRDWLEHLDILDALRTGQVQKLKRFSEYCSTVLGGYVAPGVEVGSEQEREVRERAAALDVELPDIPHELKPGFKRMPFTNLHALEQAVAATSDLTPEQKHGAVDMAKDPFGLGVVDQSLVEALMERVEARPHLAALKEWWDQIPGTVAPTAVGRVLARANAMRYDTLGLIADDD